MGDAVGKGAYTHMALYQARIVVDQLLGGPHHLAEYHAVPRVPVRSVRRRRLLADPALNKTGPAGQFQHTGKPEVTSDGTSRKGTEQIHDEPWPC